MDRHEGKQKKDSHLKWLECHAEERWHPALGMMLRRLERCLYRSETHKTCVEDAVGAGKWARASRRWLWESWSSWSRPSNMDESEKRASCFKLLCFSSSPASVNLLEKLRGVCVYVCSSFSLCVFMCTCVCMWGVSICVCMYVWTCVFVQIPSYLSFLSSSSLLRPYLPDVREMEGEAMEDILIQLGVCVCASLTKIVCIYCI